MAKIVLIGTSHKYQTRDRNNKAEHVDQFEHMLSSLCSTYECMGIAEEASQAALAELGVSESVAQVVSAALEVPHQLSDPPPEIREQLGIICDEAGFRMDRWFENWSQERIEAAVRNSHESREKYWLTQLQTLNASPLLFICGANHLEPFAALLRENEFEVVVAFSDWAPNPAVNRTLRDKAAQRRLP